MLTREQELHPALPGQPAPRGIETAQAAMQARTAYRGRETHRAALLRPPPQQLEPVLQPRGAVEVAAPGHLSTTVNRSQPEQAPRIEPDCQDLTIERQDAIQLAQQRMRIVAEIEGVAQHHEIDRTAGQGQRGRLRAQAVGPVAGDVDAVDQAPAGEQIDTVLRATQLQAMQRIALAQHALGRRGDLRMHLAAHRRGIPVPQGALRLAPGQRCVAA